MKRRSGLFIGLLFAALFMMELPAQVQAAYRDVKLRLVSSSDIAWGRVYVDGRYRGTVRRTQFLTLRLQTGRTYYFSLARNWDGKFYSRFKEEFIDDSSTTKYVYFSPIKRGEEGAAAVRVRLDSSAAPDWMDVQLYYNKKFGRVYRGSSLLVPVPAGKKMRVVVRRVWNGEIHRKTMYVTLSENETRTLNMRPVNIGSASNFNSGSNSGTTQVRCKLTSSAKIAWGRLYVDGRYKGVVRRSSYLDVPLASGRSYRMTVKRTWNGRDWFREKTVYVKAGSSQIEFFHPMAKSGGSSDSSSSRRIKVQLTSTSKIAWGRLYVNGRYNTVVRRNSAVYLNLTPGRSYKFEVKRTWNGKNWLRSKTVFIASGSDAKVIYFHPTATGDSGSTAVSSDGVLKVRLNKESRVAWAELTVSGESKGKVRRTAYLELKVPGGKYYSLVLTRTYNGHQYRVTKRVYVAAGGTETVMLTPVRTD